VDNAVEHTEVVEAELVDDGHLPAVPKRPVVTRHTILRPGQTPDDADGPRYTERDFYVSEETARRMDEASAAKNTDRNYRSQRGIFERWCNDMGRVPRPCTTATYVEYVASLIAREYRPNTINTHMAAVRSWQPEDAKPGTQVARGMLNEYRKAWSKRNRVRKAPPITRPMLEAMVATCDLRHPIGLRDRCALLVGRAALNRRIELADLTIEDVEVEEDGIAEWVAYSKNDQAAEGEETWVPADPDNPLYDPVEAVRDWLNCLHHMLRVNEGPLLRALTSKGMLQNRSTATERGDFVTGDAVNDWVRGRAYKAGLKDWHKVTAHGLRRGGAQEIADAGGDPTKQGRWKEGSAVVKREYLDRAQSRKENPWLLVAEQRRQKG
jgi:integrase